MKYTDDLKIAYAKLSPQAFEDSCCRLMPLFKSEYREIASNQNALGKTCKGTPDASVRTADGRYIAFQFTTQQTGIKEKILSDISVLTSKKCHFTEKITKVVICINANLSSDIELYYQSCEKLGWHCEIYSLDDLVRISKDYSEFCKNYLKVFIPTDSNLSQNERFYLCGERITVLREERSILPSQFIELIDHYSEKSLHRIESNEDECSLSLLNSISELTGAQLEWIKHGIGKKYLVECLPYYDLKKSIDLLKAMDPKEIYFCLNTDDFSLYLIVKSSKYCWSSFYMGYSLDFWNWIDDHRYIPDIFTHLKKIYKVFEKSKCWVRGRLFNKSEFGKLEDANITFLGSIMKNLPEAGEHWIDDILDIDHKYCIPKNYESMYGKWFVDVQSHFRKET